MINDLVHGLLEVGDEALWIWSHALRALWGLKELDADFEFIPRRAGGTSISAFPRSCRK